IDDQVQKFTAAVRDLVDRTGVIPNVKVKPIDPNVFKCDLGDNNNYPIMATRQQLYAEGVAPKNRKRVGTPNPADDGGREGKYYFYALGHEKTASALLVQTKFGHFVYLSGKGRQIEKTVNSKSNT